MLTRAGFTGPVDFVAEGDPPGAVLGFVPNPSLANTSLLVTPGNSTPSGRYPITVTARAGGVSRTTTVTLVVRRTGPFISVVGPLSVPVARGNDARIRVGVTAPNGGPPPFAELTVAGLPLGAAVRDANLDDAENDLLITTSPATPVGTYPLTITIQSGTFVRRSTVSLVVVSAPGFGIAATAAFFDAPRGSAVVVPLRLTATNGFTGPVAYTLTGVPQGWRTAVTPSSAGADITIEVPSDAVTGPRPIRAVVSSGSQTATAFVTLTVR